MLRPTKAVVAATGAWILGFSGSPGIANAVQSPGAFYVKVEVKGQLLAGKSEGTAKPGAPTIRANEIVLELEFGENPPSPKELEGLFGRIVLAKGLLHKRTDASGIDHYVLKSERKPDVLGKLDYLVGYHEGEEKAVEILCKELGLRIIEHYRPGKYFHIEPTHQTPLNFEDLLKKSTKSVRYVESNIEYTIKPEIPDSRPSIR